MARNFRKLQDGVIETTARGAEVLRTPAINKGTAFTVWERHSLGLAGLLPPHVLTLDEQAQRAYRQYSDQISDLHKNVNMTSLHDRNEVLFYRLLIDHLREMLPIVYTPTVGDAIMRYSHEYRRPGGVYLSIDEPEGIEEALFNYGAHHNEIDLIVATDSEAILGIGDWGVGGIDISLGKLAVYTAAAGIDPDRTMPVVLDVGTDNEQLLDDPLYIGNRHERVRDHRYDEFIDAYVNAASRMFPRALLHWEDFGASNARRIVQRYRAHHCTFNDDMQGTGAIVLAAAMSAVRRLCASLSDQRIVVFGAGTAGAGVADQIRDHMVREGTPLDEATLAFWCLGRHGLIVEGMEGVRDFQRLFARPVEDVAGWTRDASGCIPLAEVVRRVHPTMLLGTSTTPGAFTEEIIREMASHVEHPIVLPLSNPTSLAEAHPSDLLTWSEGRALVVTGSPFDPVTYAGRTYEIGQANNALLFPGLGLGAIVTRARMITDGMFAAAADAVAGMVVDDSPGASLLPRVEDLRAVSATVAAAVVRAAIADDVARSRPDDVPGAVADAMWWPVYQRVVPAR